MTISEEQKKKQADITNENKKYGKIVGERSKRLRKELGCKQADVCKIANIHFNTLAMCEQGTGRVPSIAVLVKLADAYNVSLDYLIGRTDVRNYGMDINAKDLAHLENIKNEVLIMLGERQSEIAKRKDSL